MNWRHLRSCVVLLIGLTCSGCLGNGHKLIDFGQWRGEGYEGRDEIWGRKYRPRDTSISPAGVDGKALDIERSLGVE